MSTLGLILRGPHYPAPPRQTGALDPRLRKAFCLPGDPIARLIVFDVANGELPDDPARCDAWVVSGPADPWAGTSAAEDRLAAFLRAVAGQGRPLFALYHAEAFVHAALTGLCDGTREGREFPRSVRNPLVAPAQGERVYRWNAVAGCLVEVPLRRSPLTARIGAKLRAVVA